MGPVMLWVGQLGIVDGEAREESPSVGVYPEPARSEQQPVDLYVIVEPALPDSEQYCAELRAAIGSVFHERRASLTGGLLRALQAAHQDLHEWNRKSLKEHRVAAGASCLAVRGSEAYLAQVAPACVLELHRGALSRRVASLPDAAEPLGLHEEFWPEFSRFDIADGDRLLLVTTALADVLAEEEWAETLGLSPPEVLPAVYRRVKEQGAPLSGGALLAAAEPALPPGPDQA